MHQTIKFQTYQTWLLFCLWKKSNLGFSEQLLYVFLTYNLLTFLARLLANKFYLFQCKLGVFCNFEWEHYDPCASLTLPQSNPINIVLTYLRWAYNQWIFLRYLYISLLYSFVKIWSNQIQLISWQWDKEIKLLRFCQSVAFGWSLSLSLSKKKKIQPQKTPCWIKSATGKH